MTNKIALHEAAHALVAVCLKHPLLDVRLGNNSFCEFKKSTTVEDLIKDTIATFAGYLAVTLGGMGDLEKVRENVSRLRKMGVNHDERWYCEQAQAILSKPDAILAISLVADALEKYGSLTEEDIKIIVGGIK